MPEIDEVVSQCAGCGAVIYPEQLRRHAAEYMAGKLMCSHCVAERKGGGGHPPPAPAAPQAAPAAGVDAKIALVDEGDVPPTPVRATGTAAATEAATPRPRQTLRRAPDPGSDHATRCKTFHCKLSEGAVVYLNDQVNEWVDAHEEITIKFATSTIGIFEGKHSEQHLVLTVFY